MIERLDVIDSHWRFFHVVKSLSHTAAASVRQINYDWQMALVVKTAMAWWASRGFMPMLISVSVFGAAGRATPRRSRAVSHENSPETLSSHNSYGDLPLPAREH
jgi:hypothetical protein